MKKGIGDKVMGWFIVNEEADAEAAHLRERLRRVELAAAAAARGAANALDEANALVPENPASKGSSNLRNTKWYLHPSGFLYI